jgi:hypothetical protein
MSVTEQESPLYGLMVKLGVSIGNLHHEVKKINERQEMERLARRASQPSFFTVPLSGGSILNAANGQNGPSQGYFWLIRSITVTDISAALATAFVGNVLVGVTPAANPSGVNPIDVNAVLTPLSAGGYNNPIYANFGGEELLCHGDENLSIQVIGGTANHQYLAVVRGIQVQEAAFRENWAI